MIEMTIAAHDAAEIQVIADALQRIAALRQQSAQTAQITLPLPPEAASALAQTNTVTVVEAPKRRGRPPKKADEAAVEAAEERAAIQAEATLTVTEPESDDDIPLEPAAPAAAPAPAPAPAPALTLEAVRATLAAASQAGKAAGVKAALASLGAVKLTDVSPANYAQLLSKVGAL